MENSKIIGQVKKNTSEILKISIEEYNGHEFIDLRVYFDSGSGTYLPTKKGITLNGETISSAIDFLKKGQTLLKSEKSKKVLEIK